MSPTPPSIAPASWQEVASVRMQLRHYVVAELKENTLAGCRVFSNRSTRIDAGHEPIILVHAKDEPAAIFEDSPRSYRRELTLWLDLYAEATTGDPDPSDVIDVLAAQVEARMVVIAHALNQASQALGDNAPWTFAPSQSGLRGTSMDVDGEGAVLEAGARITWGLVYVEAIDEARFLPQSIQPFALAVVNWDIDSDGEVDATDDIHPPQP